MFPLILTHPQWDPMSLCILGPVQTPLVWADVFTGFLLPLMRWLGIALNHAQTGMPHGR